MEIPIDNGLSQYVLADPSRMLHAGRRCAVPAVRIYGYMSQSSLTVSVPITSDSVPMR